MLPYDVAVYYIVLQCVGVQMCLRSSCSVALQCDVCNVMQQCVVVCCSMLQCATIK